MPPTATADRYLSIDGIPLDTAAWETDQLDALYDRYELVGTPTLHIQGKAGEDAQPVTPGVKRIPVPIVVYGDVDADGVPHANPADGLEVNVEQLRRLARPNLATADGTRTIRWHRPDRDTLTAPGLVAASFQTALQGQAAALLLFDLLLPGGVWRQTTPVQEVSSSSSSTYDVTIGHPGDADQTAATIVLSGTATSVRIEQRTWAAAGTTWLGVDVPLSGGAVTIDTAAFTAVQAAADVHGLLDSHTDGPLDSWLPLVAGVDNVLRIIPTGGAVQTTVTHHPSWG
jgi:hypothetical protein